VSVKINLAKHWLTSACCW